MVTALIWSTSSLLECWMHRVDYKSTSEPRGILGEFGCNQESVAASIPAKFGSRCPRPDTGSAPGSAREQNSVSTGLVLQLLLNRCIVEDLIAPWAKSARPVSEGTLFWSRSLHRRFRALLGKARQRRRLSLKESMVAVSKDFGQNDGSRLLQAGRTTVRSHT